MFRAFYRPSSGAQRPQWQPLALPSYPGDSRAVFVVGPAGRPDHKHRSCVGTCCLTIMIYRVIIKPFPDYKHLLQENYVEYKHTCYHLDMCM
jgi:hypothetical protein